MGKRFTDTEKWQPWFRRLSPTHKCFWLFLLDKCDQAGVWTVDRETALSCVGQDLNLLDAYQQINTEVHHETGEVSYRERIIKIHEGKRWHIVDFILYQYGRLSPGCKPHIPVINLLEKHRIKAYPKGINTLEEKEQEKEKENKGIVKGGGAGRPSLEEIKAEFRGRGFAAEAEKFFDYYESNGWRVGKNPMKNWRSAVANWLRNGRTFGSVAVASPKRDKKPNPKCEACSGTGKLPKRGGGFDGFPCWCFG